MNTVFSAVFLNRRNVIFGRWEVVSDNEIHRYPRRPFRIWANNGIDLNWFPIMAGAGRMMARIKSCNELNAKTLIQTLVNKVQAKLAQVKEALSIKAQGQFALA